MRTLEEDGERPEDIGVQFGDQFHLHALAWQKFVLKIVRTRLSHVPTMNVIGIGGDIEELFDRVGMREFYSKLLDRNFYTKIRTYEALTLEFLNTL